LTEDFAEQNINLMKSFVYRLNFNVSILLLIKFNNLEWVIFLQKVDFNYELVLLVIF